MDLGLAGKRVLVTGGSSGIGAAIATAFGAEGAHVAVNYITKPKQARALAATISAESFAVEADVSDRTAVEHMFAAVDARWGGLDVLVNNAGIDGGREVGWEVDPDLWMKVIDVNLKGAFLCAREALRRMVPARRGVILNTTSVHELIAWSGYGAYVASKAGLSMLAKTLAQEAAPYGVRVLSIGPGAIATAINQAVWTDPTSRADLLSKIPLGRVGDPRDIAGMAVVLASDIAAYMTATTIFIDGGMTDFPAFTHGG